MGVAQDADMCLVDRQSPEPVVHSSKRWEMSKSGIAAKILVAGDRHSQNDKRNRGGDQPAIARRRGKPALAERETREKQELPAERIEKPFPPARRIGLQRQPSQVRSQPRPADRERHNSPVDRCQGHYNRDHARMAIYIGSMSK